jgi:hypothetical protein
MGLVGLALVPLEPTVPDYDDRAITNVIEAVRQPDAPGALGDLREALRGARCVVLVLLDGLGQLQLEERAALAPWLVAHRLDPITSVAPSTTASALTSITTGTAPGEHGLVGYRFDLHGDVLQALRWTVDGKDATALHPPEAVQRREPKLVLGGRPVPYVGKRAYATSPFTRAHLRGAAYVGVEDESAWVSESAAATEGHPLVLAYHDGIDKLAHAEGLGEAYGAAIAAADGLVTELRAMLPDDVALVVTADHGQVDVGPSAVSPSRSTLALVDKMSGEGRFRWLHAHPGSAAELAERAASELGESCWVRTRREICDAGWLGEVDDDHVSRLGDVAVVPFIDAYVPDPTEPREAGMKGRHGSLTQAEMLVPLVVG